MQRTLFNSPLAVTVLRPLSRLIYALSGWHIEGDFPNEKKFIVVGAPHTSNWDFVFMLCAGFILKQEFRWMGKDALFRPPFGTLARWAGGISIDRSHADQRVQKIADEIGQMDDLILIITPEGSRSKRKKWKTGFYHIALEAQIPIVPCYLDFSTKTTGIGKPIQPTGELEKDMQLFNDYYQSSWAKFPELYTPPLESVPDPSDSE